MTTTDIEAVRLAIDAGEDGLLGVWADALLDAGEEKLAAKIRQFTTDQPAHAYHPLPTTEPNGQILWWWQSSSMTPVLSWVTSEILKLLGGYHQYDVRSRRKGYLHKTDAYLALIRAWEERGF